MTFTLVMFLEHIPRSGTNVVARPILLVICFVIFLKTPFARRVRRPNQRPSNNAEDQLQLFLGLLRRSLERRLRSITSLHTRTDLTQSLGTSTPWSSLIEVLDGWNRTQSSPSTRSMYKIVCICSRGRHDTASYNMFIAMNPSPSRLRCKD